MNITMVSLGSISTVCEAIVDLSLKILASGTAMDLEVRPPRREVWGGCRSSSPG